MAAGWNGLTRRADPFTEAQNGAACCDICQRKFVECRNGGSECQSQFADRDLCPRLTVFQRNSDIVPVCNTQNRRCCRLRCVLLNHFLFPDDPSPANFRATYFLC